MLLRELFRKLPEGGYDSADAAVQSTVINPAIVKRGLAKMKVFVDQFNQYLAAKGIQPVKIGTPTGSSAYHDIDPADAIYGDIDLQIIVPELPELEGKTTAQVQSHWYKIEDDFVNTVKPAIHPSSHPGHPILDIGNNEFVQVDMMIHPTSLAPWGAARVIPERGVKGLLHGNMYSVLGDQLTMSIQHAGVQFKVRDNVKQPYGSTRGKYELVTLSTDPENFVMDIFNHEAEEQGIQGAKVHPLLQKHPGKDLQDVKISNLVNAVKGLAYSFELNNMYGKGDLTNYKNAQDFLNQFLANYEAKAIKSASAGKFEKVTEPHAVARAQSDKKKILSGLEMVRGLFQKNEQAVAEAGKRLTSQGVDVSRVNREDFLHIKSLLNPLLQQTGIKAGWTSGGAGSFDPEHEYGGGGREDSGDVDIMIDPQELVKNLAMSPEEFNKVSPKPLGPKALANVLADPAKVEKVKLTSAKWGLANHLTKNGFPTDPGNLTVNFSKGNIHYSVDLIIRPRSSWSLHTHDFSRDPGMRGGDLWNDIYPALAKASSSKIIVDPKTGEEKGNLQFSPDRGIVDRTTSKVVAIDKNDIARILLGPNASSRDLASLSGIKHALAQYPAKWEAVKQFFPQEVR